MDRPALLDTPATPLSLTVVSASLPAAGDTGTTLCGSSPAGRCAAPRRAVSSRPARARRAQSRKRRWIHSPIRCGRALAGCTHASVLFCRHGHDSLRQAAWWTMRRAVPSSLVAAGACATRPKRCETPMPDGLDSPRARRGYHARTHAHHATPDSGRRRTACVTFRTRACSCGLMRALAHVPTSMSTAAASSRAPRGGAPSALYTATRNMPGQSCDPRHPSRAIENRCSTTLVPFDHPTRESRRGAVP